MDGGHAFTSEEVVRKQSMEEEGEVVVEEVEEGEAEAEGLHPTLLHSIAS